MKDIKIIISSLLIVISFFIWYFLSETKKGLEKTQKYNYVNIEVLKTKIKVSKDDNTKITINWNIVESEIYDLK